MNTKLELVRLSNEDVIATSACAVGELSFHGTAPNEEYNLSIYVNNSSYGDFIFKAGKGNSYQGITEDGYYHCDVNGNIIEKCNHGTEERDVLAAHGVIVPLP